MQVRDPILLSGLISVANGSNCSNKISKYLIYLRPQQDSNLRTRLRRPLLYPLSYGGWHISRPTHHSRRPDQQYQERGSPDTQLICAHQLARADTLAP